MALRLIIGRAGAGKTARCLREIRTELGQDPLGTPLIFLVPEQATFQMEQALLQSSGIAGTARATILSFQRLATWVLSEAGGLTKPRLGDVGKRMLLRSLAVRRKSDLHLFSRSVNEPGFSERLAVTFSEFRMHGYGPKQVQEMARRAAAADNVLLGHKLQDLALLYEDYIHYIIDRYAEPVASFDEVADKLARYPLLQDARVWVDGFAGFTPPEYRVLEAVLKQARQVDVALCLDTDLRTKDENAKLSGDTARLFGVPLHTARKLISIAKQTDIPVLPPVLMSDPGRAKRFRRPELEHIERMWDEPRPTVFSGAVGAVRLVSTDDRRTEVEHVAAEIRRLVGQHGYRYRDVAVIVRDLDTYAPYIRAAFSEGDVPFFLDQRRPMHFHPLLQVVGAALHTLASYWNSAGIIRYLKTDLASLTRDETDELENYVMRYGITGKSWRDRQPWRFSPDDEGGPKGGTGASGSAADIDRLRREAVAPLLQLDAVIGRGREFTPRAAAEAIWEFTETLRIGQRLEQWIDEAESRGETERVSLHMQVWNAYVALLEQLANVLPQHELSLDVLLSMVEEGFDSLRLGLIPPKLDQVLVGAVDRSRQPDVRAVFVLGLVDREFPAVPVEDAVFTDKDRDALEEMHYPLGETSTHLLDVERFYAYIAVTRAAERLYLSWPRSDAGGRALHPSAVITKVQRLLPTTPLQTITGEDGDFSGVVTARQAAGLAARGLRANPEDARSRSAYEWLVTSPQSQHDSKRIWASLAYTNAVVPLSPDMTSGLYGRPLSVSISRLERFAACPFQHFAAYGLALKERDILRLDPGRLGVLTHRVLSDFVNQLMAEKIDWATIADEEAYALIDSLIVQAAADIVGDTLLASGRMRYMVDATRRTLRTTVRLLNEHARHGSFRPVATEVSFGRKGSPLPGWEFTLHDDTPVRVVGIVDRVDVAHIDGVPHVRVVDYKGYRRSIVWSDILAGLELQLLVYAGVVSDNKQWLPAGAFYIPVQDPYVATETDFDEHTAWDLKKKKLKAEGIIVDDNSPHMGGHFDETTTPGSTSALFPFGIKKDGDYTAASKTVSGQQMEQLLTAVDRVVKGLTARIHGGEHGAVPYRRPNGRRACERCPYHSVCRFDILIEGNAYNHLETYNKDGLWQRLDEHGATSKVVQ